MASPMKSLSGKGKPKTKSKAKKPAKKKIKHMHISPADNGGFDVHHIMDGGDEGQMPEPESHPVGSPDELLQHVQSQFGGQMPQQGGGPAGPGGGGM